MSEEGNLEDVRPRKTDPIKADLIEPAYTFEKRHINVVARRLPSFPPCRAVLYHHVSLPAVNLEDPGRPIYLIKIYSVLRNAFKFREGNASDPMMIFGKRPLDEGGTGMGDSINDYHQEAEW